MIDRQGVRPLTAARVVNDLSDKEQRAVRTALRFLRLRVGAWGPLAKALRYEWNSSHQLHQEARSEQHDPDIDEDS